MGRNNSCYYLFVSCSEHDKQLRSPALQLATYDVGAMEFHHDFQLCTAAI
jgi:hypothetical protein